MKQRIFARPQFVGGVGARRRNGREGQALTEFVLVAPFIFVFTLGLLAISIVVTNQSQLTNSVRNGARAAAICGSRFATSYLPNGQICSTTNVEKYIESGLQVVPSSGVTFTLNICTVGQSQSCATGTGEVLGLCEANSKLIEIKMSYLQPLYVPFLAILGDPGNSNFRTITAQAEALCLQ